MVNRKKFDRFGHPVKGEYVEGAITTYNFLKQILYSYRK